MRDPEAEPAADDIVVDPTWSIVQPAADNGVAAMMAEMLARYFAEVMEINLPVVPGPPAGPHIRLDLAGGGKAERPESFTITATSGLIRVAGADVGGLRDGVVRLIDLFGFRMAPFLAPQDVTYTPRIRMRRSGSVPVYQQTKFPEDDPVFAAHPDIRGARTWSADGEFTLCTEHPRVQQFLEKSIEAVFPDAPDLDGIEIIIGGEGFYHCFMRPYGVEKGHTNCARCEQIGPDTVVSNLVNRLARPRPLRRVWTAVSEAIEWTPHIPSYYTGPLYIGPARNMASCPRG